MQRIGYILKEYLHKRQLNWREKEHSLVHTGIVSLVSRKAEHATDDSAVHLSPLIITYLLPFASILHLHVALCHWDTLTIWWQDGPNTNILYLNVQTLKDKKNKYCYCKTEVDLWWTLILVLAIKKNCRRVTNFRIDILDILSSFLTRNVSRVTPLSLHFHIYNIPSE